MVGADVGPALAALSLLLAAPPAPPGCSILDLPRWGAWRRSWRAPPASPARRPRRSAWSDVVGPAQVAV